MQLRSGRVLSRRLVNEIFGDLRVYLRPQPVWDKLPRVLSKKCVHLDEYQHVEGKLNGHVFRVYITSASQNTFMGHRLAREIGLLAEIEIHEDWKFNFSHGPRVLSVGCTGEVEISLAGDVSLKARMQVLPDDESLDFMGSCCYVGVQALADNNIMQRFSEKLCMLNVRPPSVVARGKERECYLSGHLNLSLLDPPIKILVNSSTEYNYMCSRGREKFPPKMCTVGVRNIVFPMGFGSNTVHNVCPTPENIDTHFSLGQQFLTSTDAALDYSRGHLYIKVKQRRYKLQMYKFEELCESCWNGKHDCHEKVDKPLLITQVRNDEESYSETSTTVSTSQEKGVKRKRTEETSQDEQQEEKKLKSVSSNNQQSQAKRKREETETTKERRKKTKRECSLF